MPPLRDVAKEDRARGTGIHILPALPASLGAVGVGCHQAVIALRPPATSDNGGLGVDALPACTIDAPMTRRVRTRKEERRPIAGGGAG
jgi:hypothetical protein